MILEKSKQALSLAEDKVYIGTVADLFVFSEHIKNNVESHIYDSILSRFEEQNIFWAELTTKVFIDNVFEDFHDNTFEFTLDREIHNSKINPTITCNCIILRPNKFDCFWDQNVYDEMLETHV